MFRLF